MSNQVSAYGRTPFLAHGAGQPWPVPADFPEGARRSASAGTGYRGSVLSPPLLSEDRYGSPIRAGAGPYYVEGDTWGAVALALVAGGVYLRSLRRR